MRLRGYRELFTCTGRACGSSDYWANDIFENRILYGPVRNQFYLAMGSEPPGQFYVAAYVITRSNRQLLAYLEIVELAGGTAIPADASPAFLLDQLRETGAIVLPGLSFATDDELRSGEYLDDVVEMLGLAPDLRLYVVAHLQGEGSLDDLLGRSEARAQSVVQLLVNQGIDAGRLAARGLGPLSPICAAGNCAGRVELVLRPAR